MVFMIQTQGWPRAHYKVETGFCLYKTFEEAQAVIEQRRKDGWKIPMRVVNEKLEVVTR